MQLLKSISTLPFYNALISSVICLCNASINNGYGFRFITFCIYCKVNNTLKISVFEKIYDRLCAVIVAYDIAKIYICKQITTYRKNRHLVEALPTITQRYRFFIK